MSQISLFGWEFKRKNQSKEQLPSFTPQETNDGAVLISAGSGYGTYVDLDGTVRTEAELVTKYREMSLHPECDSAIDEIVNESIAIEDENIIAINLENVKTISEKLASVIKEEFRNCLKLLDFSSHAYDIYRRWYIDGRLYFHVIIDKDRPTDGIKELRYVDPRKIRKVREISKHKINSNNPGDAVVSQTVNEYYIFNDKGFNYGNKVVGPSTSGLKIARDSILHVVSGLTDNQGTMVLSYLHKCLPKNTRIRTPSGWKYLKDIEKGDEVYSYNIEDNSFEKSKVIDKWGSGVKSIISIRTRHTTFDCSYEHKILVRNNKTKRIEYIEAQNLFPKVHQVRLANNYNNQFGEEIEFPISNRSIVCKIENPEVWVKSNILHKKKIIRDVANELDIKFSKVYSFIYGYGVLSETSAQNIINRLPIKLNLIKKLEGMCSNKLNIPRYIDERFARLFGFLLGDGCVNKYTVSFAEGINKSQNIFYCNLMRDFFGNCERINSTGRKYSSWYTNNTLAAELLKNLDFITGAKNKRIPSWVFRAETFIQYAFMQGFMDADGCYDDTDMDEEKTLSCRINLSNEELIYDIKELWTLLGYSSGKVTKQKIKAFGKLFIGYNIYLSKRLLPEWENIIEISGKEEEEEVFDITVDHPSHNFIANHMVCSNSIKCLNQLRTLEDALVIYRLCLVGESRITTPNGYTYIKDLKEGDDVYSFDGEKLVPAIVKKQWCTGEKQTFSVRSKHHEVIGTDNHPILVRDKENGVISYVDIKDLICGKHQFIYMKPEDNGKDIEFPDLNYEYNYRLKNKKAFIELNIKGKEKLIDYISSELKISRHKIKHFLNQNYPLHENEVYEVLKRIPFNETPELIKNIDINGRGYEINIPKCIDENFARLFGFMIGDGYIVEGKTSSQIRFAGGIDKLQNEYYQNLMIQYFGNCISRFSEKVKYGEYFSYNTLGAKLFKKLGFISGAKNKRIPQWVFNSKNSIKKSFIQGLADADGCMINLKNNWSSRIKLCNKRLIEDIKEVWTSLGLSSGQIRYEKVQAKKISGRQVKNDSDAWAVQISDIPLSNFETINTIEMDNIENVYELEVDDELHNFCVSYTILHNSRAPERRIWYIDVGNLPKIKAEQYLRDIMVRHRNRLIYDAQDGSVKDDRKFMCFALDTKIPLLNGKTLTLEEIIDEYKSGKQNWVYSCDPKTGKFFPGPVSWAGITKKNSDVVRVTLDNGKSVVCTPDHKFILRDGSGFKEAQYLIPGDSLMPGYRKEEILHGSGNEYEKLYCNESKKWEFTHRLVSKWKDDVGLREEYIFDKNYISSNKFTTHHKDFNRFNNYPDNLVIMNNTDHLLYHSSTSYVNHEKMKELKTIYYPQEMIEKIIELVKCGKISKYILKQINVEKYIREFIELNKEQLIVNKDMKEFLHNDLVRIANDFGFKNWLEFRKKYVKTSIERKEIKRVFTEEWKEKISQKRKVKVNHCKTWKITTPNNDNDEIIDNLNKYCNENNLHRTNIKGRFGSKGYFAEQLHNHKVVSVEFLSEKMDVGCLTIDKDETYHSPHNFLLDFGAYAKNTMMEDYWLPRREGGKGTEVITLPGGQTLGQMDDVLYFQKKFLNALNVPISRLNSDALDMGGSATGITRDELKFQKFVIRLRIKFTCIFNDLLQKQLVLKRIMSVEEWEQISSDVKYDYACDNYFNELKKAEIAQNRINLASAFQPMADKYYSHQWIRKEVLHQTDDNIKDLDKEIKKEVSSTDPRWINPEILQNESMGDQLFNQKLMDMHAQSMGQIPGQMEQQQKDNPEKDNSNEMQNQDQQNQINNSQEPVRQAVDFIKLMKEKGKPNRSMQDEAKYKEAVKLLAQSKSNST